MKLFCELVRELIVILGLGKDSTTEEWSVFYSKEPPTPDNCITVYEAPSEGPQWCLNKSDPIFEWGSVQIRVRALTIGDAYAKAREIQIALCNRGPTVESALTGVGLKGLLSMGSIYSLGQDENERSIVTVNFRSARTPVD